MTAHQHDDHTTVEVREKRGGVWDIIGAIGFLFLGAAFLIGVLTGFGWIKPPERRAAYTPPQVTSPAPPPATTLTEADVQRLIDAAAERQAPQQQQQQSSTDAATTAPQQRQRVDTFQTVSELNIGDTQICRDDIWVFITDGIDEDLTNDQRQAAVRDATQAFCNGNHRTPYEGETQVGGRPVPYIVLSDEEVAQRRRS